MHNTLQRNAILKVLQNPKKHFTAYDIHRILMFEVPQISLATVYRNLKQLSSAGSIKNVTSISPKKYFENNSSKHFHNCCPCCGKLEDISNDPQLDEFLLKKTAELGCQNYHLEFQTVCPDCQQKLNAEKSAVPTRKKPLSLR